jgi:hypothetical protein
MNGATRGEWCLLTGLLILSIGSTLAMLAGCVIQGSTVNPCYDERYGRELPAIYGTDC